MDWGALDRHEGRVAVYFSGGKDSTAILHLMRHAGLLDRVTVFHLRTSDAFPEMVAHVEMVRAWCPNFVLVETDPIGWARANGDPTDLVPHSAHVIGQSMAEGARLSSRYDCCWHNLMRPMDEAVRCAGMTLAIRGTRRDDMSKLPMASGDVVNGLELLLPLQDWTEADVWDYTRANDVPVCGLYEAFPGGSSPECMTCTAWWNVDAGPFLKARHPEQFAKYQARMANVMRETAPCMANLKRVLSVMEDAA